MLAASLALATAPLASAPLADTQVLLGDGSAVATTQLKPGPSDDRVVLELAAGAPRTLSVSDLLALDFGRNPGKPLVPTVRFVNGDQIHGKVYFPTPGKIRVVGGWGGLTAPLAWCQVVRLDDKSPLPEPSARDVIILANDRVEGAIQSVNDKQATTTLSGKPVTIDLARIKGFAFGPRARTEPAREGTRVQVSLGGGERVTGMWVRLSVDTLAVKLDWGDVVEIPTGSIARVEVQNGKLIYLSSLTPSEIRTTSYLEGPPPVIRTDRSAADRPIRLRGRTFGRGLGMRSKSEVTYNLDAPHQTFAATVGLDDAVGDRGSVIFRVFGDERLLVETPVVRGGNPPIDLKVDIRKVLVLRLEVDFADDGDLADQADWADARLMRN